MFTRSPRLILPAALLLLLCALPATAHPAPADSVVTVGSKSFTESVVLGWVATHAVAATAASAQHRAQLGGSRFLWEALLRGDIDVYPEYTGTLVEEILADTQVTASTLRDTLNARGIRMSGELGFNNTYALGMREAQAERLGIEAISDLRAHPDLQVGFTNEFMERGDGWPSLQQAYDLSFAPRGLDHDLAYRALANGALDVIDLYATDAEIQRYDVRVLRDDRNHFPAYRAVLLYRSALAAQVPKAVDALQALEGRFPADTMRALNASVAVDGRPARTVAAHFVTRTLNVQVAAAAPESRAGRVWSRTQEHLALVGLSLGIAIVLSIPLGIVAAKVRVLGLGVLLVVGVTYTVPALALLALMVPPLGVGYVPAVTALVVYSLLPIVWNTYTGLRDIAPDLQDSAAALGLSAAAQLGRVELPLAAGSILAGIKIAIVINVGTATLGALIGAGGYGQPILTGIRRADLGLILEGTLPAAVLTVLLLAVAEGIERIWIRT